MDLVSVIVPIYNVEKYLRRCIESILRQTYTNLEIILVDDGSPDGCGEICDSYVDERIVVIHQKNQGVSVARNTGLDYCHGEWIAFIDSDDFITDDYIEYLVDLCKKNDTLISQCGFIRGRECVFREETLSVVEKVWNFSDLYKSKGRDFRGIVWTKIFNASLFKNIRFIPNKSAAEDEDVAFRTLFYAKKIAISNRHLYYYYMSPDSLSRTTKKAVNYDFLDIFEYRVEFLKNNNGEEFINTTKKELCLRLMLRYFGAQKNNFPIDELKRLREYYCRYYSELKLNAFSLKEKSALILFRFCPNFFSFMENNFSVIQKNRLSREKK